MFWNVQGTAFQQTLGRFNHDHLGSGGRVSTHGRRKKRLFGQRYMSVNDREISVGNGGGNDTRTSGADSCGGRKQGPLFSDTECKCRSAVTMLDAGEGEFVAPDQSLVPFSFANIVEGFGGEASQAEDGKEEAPAAEPQGETAAAEAADLAAARAQVCDSIYLCELSNLRWCFNECGRACVPGTRASAGG